MDNKMDNRRQAIRWQIDHKASVRLEEGDTYDCTVSDIGLKGCKLCLEVKLPRNRRFALTLILSDECSIDVEAWVAWHRTVEEYDIYGICFSRIRDNQRDKVYQIIRNDFPEQINRQWWEGGVTMEEKAFVDRRIFERFSVNLPLKYISRGIGSEGEGQTFDVSAKGIGMLAEQGLPLRTALEIWVSIPDQGEPLYARGEVVWSKPAEIGGYRIGVNLERADLMGMGRVLKSM